MGFSLMAFQMPMPGRMLEVVTECADLRRLEHLALKRVTMTVKGCWRWYENVQTSGKSGVKCWRCYTYVQTSGVGIV